MALLCLVVPFILCLVIPNYNCYDILASRLNPSAEVLPNGNKRIVRRTVYYVPKYQSNPSNEENNGEEITNSKVTRSVANPDWYLNAFDNKKSSTSQIAGNKHSYLHTANSNFGSNKDPSNTFKYSKGETSSNIQTKSSSQEQKQAIYKAKWSNSASKISKTKGNSGTGSSEETVQKVNHAAEQSNYQKKATSNHESHVFNVPVVNGNGQFMSLASSQNTEDKANEVSVTNTSKLSPEQIVLQTIDNAKREDVSAKTNKTDILVEPTTNALDDSVKLNQRIKTTNIDGHKLVVDNKEHEMSSKIGLNKGEYLSSSEESSGSASADINSISSHRSLHGHSDYISNINRNFNRNQNKGQNRQFANHETITKYFHTINNIKPQERGLKDVDYMRALIELIERINADNKYNVNLASLLITILNNILKTHQQQKHKERLVIPPAVQRLTVRVINAAAKCSLDRYFKNLSLSNQSPTENYIKRLHWYIGQLLKYKQIPDNVPYKREYTDWLHYLRNGKIKQFPWRALRYYDQNVPESFKDMTLRLNIILSLNIPKSIFTPVNPSTNWLNPASPIKNTQWTVPDQEISVPVWSKPFVKQQPTLFNPNLQMNDDKPFRKGRNNIPKEMLRSLKPLVDDLVNRHPWLLPFVKNGTKIVADVLRPWIGANDQDKEHSEYPTEIENPENIPPQWFDPEQMNNPSHIIDKDDPYGSPDKISPWNDPMKNSQLLHHPAYARDKEIVKPWQSPTKNVYPSFDINEDIPIHDPSNSPYEPQKDLPLIYPMKHSHPSDNFQEIKDQAMAQKLNHWNSPYPLSAPQNAKDHGIDDTWVDPFISPHDPLNKRPWTDPTMNSAPLDGSQHINEDPWLNPTKSKEPSILDENNLPWNDPFKNIFNPHKKEPWMYPTKNSAPLVDPQYLNEDPWLDPTKVKDPLFSDDENNASQNMFNPHKNLPWTDPTMYSEPLIDPQYINEDPLSEPTGSQHPQIYNINGNDSPWNGPFKNPFNPHKSSPWNDPTKKSAPLMVDTQYINEDPWLDPTKSKDPLIVDDENYSPWNDPFENPFNPHILSPWTDPTKKSTPLVVDPQYVNEDLWLDPTKSKDPSLFSDNESDSPWNDPLKSILNSNKNLPWTDTTNNSEQSIDPQYTNEDPWSNPTRGPPSIYDINEKDSPWEDSFKKPNDPFKVIPWTNPIKTSEPLEDSQYINEESWLHPPKSHRPSFYGVPGKDSPWYDAFEKPDDPLKVIPWTYPKKSPEPLVDPQYINGDPWLDPTKGQLRPESFEKPYDPLKVIPWSDEKKNFAPLDPHYINEQPWIDPKKSNPPSYFDIKKNDSPWADPSKYSFDIPWSDPKKNSRPLEDPQNIKGVTWLDPTNITNYGINDKDSPWLEPSESLFNYLKNTPWSDTKKNSQPLEDFQYNEEKPWLEDPSQSYVPLKKMPWNDPTENLQLPQNLNGLHWLDPEKNHRPYDIKNNNSPWMTPLDDPQYNKEHEPWLKPSGKENDKNNTTTTGSSSDVTTVPNSYTDSSLFPIDSISLSGLPNYLIPSTTASENGLTFPNYLVPITSTPTYGNDELYSSYPSDLIPPTTTMYENAPTPLNYLMPAISTQAYDDIVSGQDNLTPFMSTTSSDKEHSTQDASISTPTHDLGLYPSENLIQDTSTIPYNSEPSTTDYIKQPSTNTYPNSLLDGQSHLVGAHSLPIHSAPDWSKHDIFLSDDSSREKYNNYYNIAKKDKDFETINPKAYLPPGSKGEIEELNKKWVMEIKDDEDNSILRYVVKYLMYYRVQLRTIEFIKNQVIQLFLKSRNSCLSDTIKSVQKFLEFELMLLIDIRKKRHHLL